MTEKYARSNTDVFELWGWYKRAIGSMSHESLPHRYWYYGNFSDGSVINKEIRVAYRRSVEIMNLFDQPMNVNSGSDIRSYIKSKQEGINSVL